MTHQCSESRYEGIRLNVWLVFQSPRVIFQRWRNEFAHFLSFQEFNLFSSEAYPSAKNLMFKDSTVQLVRLPANTDSFLYLGAEYMSIVRSLKRGTVNISR